MKKLYRRQSWDQVVTGGSKMHSSAIRSGERMANAFFLGCTKRQSVRPIVEGCHTIWLPFRTPSSANTTAGSNENFNFELLPPFRLLGVLRILGSYCLPTMSCARGEAQWRRRIVDINSAFDLSKAGEKNKAESWQKWQRQKRKSLPCERAGKINVPEREGKTEMAVPSVRAIRFPLEGHLTRHWDVAERMFMTRVLQQLIPEGTEVPLERVYWLPDP